MNMSLYINAAAGIGPDQGEMVQKPLLSEPFIYAHEPDYKSHLDARKLRRMNKHVKMSCYLTKVLLEESNTSSVSSIITASGLGCTTETIKFLETMHGAENKSVLSPSAFINSTHNTPGGFLAKLLGCHGYNSTFSQRDLSFETALMDAFSLGPSHFGPVLLGAYEEINPLLVRLFKASGLISDSNVENTLKPVVPISEGCSFFLLDSVKREPKALELFIPLMNRSSKQEQHQKALEDVIVSLNEKGLKNGMIFSGNNGSVSNNLNYSYLYSMDHLLSVVEFKKWTGEYTTASAAGLNLAYNIISGRSTLNTPEFIRPDFIIIVQHSLNGYRSLLTLSK
ncbi:MAG: hypothetical protein GY751_04850 [Bacteroidetes bacterium]|nr:hypothetical protein [Bacteroidota bacterium]